MTRARVVSVFASLLIALPLPLSVLEAEDPGDFNGQFRIEGGTASRGETITLPLIARGNSEIQGLSISIDFDESVLEFVDFHFIHQRPDGREWGFIKMISNSANDIPGNAGVEDEGYLVGGFIVCYSKPEEPHDPCPAGSLPAADTDHEILGLQFRVRPDAPIGETELRFLDGAHASPGGPAITNVISLKGHTADLQFFVTPTSINARLGIVEETSLFDRGDSNGDLKVDLSDAVWTLNYLFLDGQAPACMDAADANDDDHVDIADPIATFFALFMGGTIPGVRPVCPAVN